MYVGPYAEKDTDLTLKLWGYFKTELIKQDLMSIFDLETRLFPILFEMKKKGYALTLMKPRELKNYLLNEKKKYLIKSLKTQKLQWIYGQQLLWQKLLMQKEH